MLLNGGKQWAGQWKHWLLRVKIKMILSTQRQSNDLKMTSLISNKPRTSKNYPFYFGVRGYPLKMMWLAADKPSVPWQNTNTPIPPGNGCQPCTHAVPPQNNITNLRLPKRGCGRNFIAGKCFLQQDVEPLFWYNATWKLVWQFRGWNIHVECEINLSIYKNLMHGLGHFIIWPKNQIPRKMPLYYFNYRRCMVVALSEV